MKKLIISSLFLFCAINYAYSIDYSYSFRRIRVLEDPQEFNLSQIIPTRSTTGFQSLSQWIEAFESLPSQNSQQLTLAFTLNGEVLRTVSFKIPKEELLTPQEFNQVADYISLLVLWGQAFIGGDAVVGDWSDTLRDSVEERFTSGRQARDLVEGMDVPYGFDGMLEYLKFVYGSYRFEKASTEEIEALPQSNQGLLMEVDKAVVDLNPTAKGFWVPNAGPYGLPGVIEQYLNQNGVYNFFAELIQNDTELRENLAKAGRFPVVEPGDKAQRRQILEHVLSLLDGPTLSKEDREKIKDIFRKIGTILGETIKITNYFIPIKNVVLTGKVVETATAGSLIRDKALEVLNAAGLQDIKIWLPVDLFGLWEEKEGGKVLVAPPTLSIQGTEIGKFNLNVPEGKEGDFLSEYGQALAMAGEISEKLFNDITQGRVIGIDCGSSDVKIVYVKDGEVLFVKRYKWPSSDIRADSTFEKEGSLPNHQEIIQALMELARFKVALMEKGEKNLTPKEQDIMNKILDLENKSDGKSREDFDEIMSLLKEAEGIIVPAYFDGFAISWAGAVVDNKIVGRASIVKGIVSDQDFRELITPLGKKIAEHYRNVLGEEYLKKYLVINDGEAAAIMAVMMGLKNVLGLAFGTSTGGGYFGE